MQAASSSTKLTTSAQPTEIRVTMNSANGLSTMSAMSTNNTAQRLIATAPTHSTRPIAMISQTT